MKTHKDVEKAIEDAEKDASKDSKLLFLLRTYAKLIIIEGFSISRRM
jgi:hypothetical protein